MELISISARFEKAHDLLEENFEEALKNGKNIYYQEKVDNLSEEYSKYIEKRRKIDELQENDPKNELNRATQMFADNLKGELDNKYDNLCKDIQANFEDGVQKDELLVHISSISRGSEKKSKKRRAKTKTLHK